MNSRTAQRLDRRHRLARPRPARLAERRAPSCAASRRIGSAAAVLPAPAILPPAERRRASRVVKLALTIGLEAAAHAGADIATLATVFAASGADGHNCHALCEQLASDDRQISPTRFHNSVHNAAAGYWGIATQSQAPCQVLCAYDASFGAGLLDALGQVVVDRQPTLLIAYDSEYPEPLHSKRPLPDVAGIALLLTPERSARSLARIAVSLDDSAADDAGRRRAGSPARRRSRRCAACRCCDLLARGEAGSVSLDYLPPTATAASTCQPC